MRWKKFTLVGLIIGLILAIIINITSSSDWGDPLTGGWRVFWVAHILFLIIIILISNLIGWIITKIKKTNKKR